MNYESIIHLIEKGEFAESVNLVGQLLEENPEDLDFISAYYTIKYWQNREHLLYNLRNKPLSFLVEEWEKFERHLKERKYKHNIITFTLKKFIIQKVVLQLRNKFNKEGLEEKDLPLLLSLGKQLLSLQDFEVGRELLNYALKLQSYNPIIYFLLGDSFCIEGEISGNTNLYNKGLSFVRDGYLLDANNFPIEDIQSKFLNNIIKELNFIYEGQIQRIQAWLSVYIMLKSFFPELRKLTVDEITEIEKEILRLEKEIIEVSEKFYEKTLARLIFYYLVILHSLTFHYSDEERFNEILINLEQLSPKIHNEVIKILSKDV
jgi:tetratricopeptide (TPR) repeat protein